MFLSHNWGKDNVVHNQVSLVNEHLKTRGFKTWFDEENMPPTTSIEQAMARGIDSSKVFISFLTKEYMTKANGKF